MLINSQQNKLEVTFVYLSYIQNNNKKLSP